MSEEPTLKEYADARFGRAKRYGLVALAALVVGVVLLAWGATGPDGPSGGVAGGGPLVIIGIIAGIITVWTLSDARDASRFRRRTGRP